MSFVIELRRKLIHLCAGISIPFLYYYLPEFWAKWILAGVTLGVIAVDILRLKDPFVKRLFGEFFSPLIRKHEVSVLTGATYLLLSSLLCVLFFRKNIAVAAISFLVIGDTAAALVGKRIGRILFFGKSLEGSIACFMSCIIIGFIIPGFSWLVVLSGAFVATVVEALPIPLDDNLRIPLSAGLVMQIFSNILSD